jgi:hypothetical protein
MLCVLLANCNKIDPEPVSVGHYLIDNRTNLTLQLEINDTIFDEDVPPDSIFHFFSIEVGTGGSPAPYQIFSQFNVTTIINNKDSVLYEGAHPEDWEVRNTQLINENPGTEYYLIIPRY